MHVAREKFEATPTIHLVTPISTSLRGVFVLGLVRYRMDAAKWVWLSAHVQRTLGSRMHALQSIIQSTVMRDYNYVPVVEIISDCLMELASYRTRHLQEFEYVG